MATNAFGGMGLNYLGQENVASGQGLDLGRALLAMGASKSGLEGWMNQNLGLGIKNGQIGAFQPSSGAAVPASSSDGVAPPSITAPQITVPNENRGSANTADPHAGGRALLNGTSSIEPASMVAANQQQPLATNVSMPPPAPIMGGVVPSTNFDFTNGLGIRERLTKAVGAAFA